MFAVAYTVKKVSAFPVSSWEVTNWPGVIKLLPARESSVSGIPVGDRKIAILFFSVGASYEHI
jgi:hypothetical protein